MTAMTSPDGLPLAPRHPAARAGYRFGQPWAPAFRTSAQEASTVEPRPAGSQRLRLRDASEPGFAPGLLCGALDSMRLVSQGLLIALMLWLSLPGFAAATGGSERLRDLATVSGVRVNQLIGYGVVVGLDGSGDATNQVQFTGQSVQSLLSQFGVTLPPGVTPQMKNVAAVMVTASLPAFAQPGQQIDITVSSLGNARSLRGGTLLLTPLRGADSQIYAMAQGNLVVGGAGASAGGSKVAINHLLAGRVPGGATVERAVPNPTLEADVIHLELNQTDFSTARLVAEAVNQKLGGEAAVPLDARVVQVRLPAGAARVRAIAELENIEVAMAAPPAKVIINARTGSVVINQSVRLGACAVAHGNLSVTVSATPVVSQPAPLSNGQTAVVEKSDIRIQQGAGTLFNVPASADLAEIVKSLNALGASAQDLIGILQAIKAAGALKAELEIL